MLTRYATADVSQLDPALREWSWADGIGPFLWGPPGVGKSHAAVAMMRNRMQQRGLSSNEAVFVSVARMYSKKRKAISGEAFDEPDWGKVELVVLDDWDKLRITSWVQEDAFVMMDTLWARGVELITTTNSSPAVFAGHIGSFITSRLKDMVRSYEMTGQDRRGQSCSSSNSRDSTAQPITTNVMLPA